MAVSLTELTAGIYNFSILVCARDLLTDVPRVDRAAMALGGSDNFGIEGLYCNHHQFLISLGGTYLSIFYYMKSSMSIVDKIDTMFGRANTHDSAAYVPCSRGL